MARILLGQSQAIKFNSALGLVNILTAFPTINLPSMARVSLNRMEFTMLLSVLLSLGATASTSSAQVPDTVAAAIKEACNFDQRCTVAIKDHIGTAPDGSTKKVDAPSMNNISGVLKPSMRCLYTLAKLVDPKIQAPVEATDLAYYWQLLLTRDFKQAITFQRDARTAPFTTVADVARYLSGNPEAQGFALPHIMELAIKDEDSFLQWLECSDKKQTIEEYATKHHQYLYPDTPVDEYLEIHFRKLTEDQLNKTDIKMHELIKSVISSYMLNKHANEVGYVLPGIFLAPMIYNPLAINTFEIVKDIKNETSDSDQRNLLEKVELKSYFDASMENFSPESVVADTFKRLPKVQSDGIFSIPRVHLAHYDEIWSTEEKIELLRKSQSSGFLDRLMNSPLEHDMILLMMTIGQCKLPGVELAESYLESLEGRHPLLKISDQLILFNYVRHN